MGEAGIESAADFSFFFCNADEARQWRIMVRSLIHIVSAPDATEMLIFCSCLAAAGDSIDSLFCSRSLVVRSAPHLLLQPWLLRVSRLPRLTPLLPLRGRVSVCLPLGVGAATQASPCRGGRLGAGLDSTVLA